MNTQINLRLPEKIIVSARSYAEKHGFSTIQEFIKETLREKLFDADRILTDDDIKSLDESEKDLKANKTKRL